MPNVLIIEDNDLNRDMLTRRLARRGWQVIQAINGREGIEAAVTHLPDLILMDMSLPEVDGWTATTFLKQGAQTSQIPILALTAHAMVGDQEKALAAGCDEFETKPVELSRLLAKMEALVARGWKNGD